MQLQKDLYHTLSFSELKFKTNGCFIRTLQLDKLKKTESKPNFEGLYLENVCHKI